MFKLNAEINLQLVFGNCHAGLFIVVVNCLIQWSKLKFVTVIFIFGNASFYTNESVLKVFVAFKLKQKVTTIH